MSRLAAAAAIWLALAGPALALVDDPLLLLDPSVSKAMNVEMKNINADRLDVLILRGLPPDVDGMARLRFLEKQRPPNAGVLMVGLETKQIGVYLGEDFTRHGVTPGVVQRLVQRTYKPLAAKDETSEAVLALVREIKLARTLGRDPELAPPPPKPTFALPWWWYLPPVVAILLGLGGYYGARRRRSMRRRARLRGLVDRLEDLNWQLKQQEPAIAKLAEAETLGEPNPKLDARIAALRKEREAVAKVATDVSAALKHGDWERAGQLLDDGLQRTFPLTVGLAGALAAQQDRLQGADPVATMERTRDLLTRWQRLAEARTRWTPGKEGANGPQQLGERLESVGKLLATAPLDVAGAEDFLAATEAIFGRALEPSYKRMD